MERGLQPRRPAADTDEDANRSLAVADYRETPLGPNEAVRFNRQRSIRCGQGSYVLAVIAPSDPPQS